MQENNFILRFQKYFPDKLLSVELLNHPGNNKNYKAKTSNAQFIIKEYSTFQKDNWNRGLREFKTLRYLRDLGIKGLPTPIRFFKEDNIAIYSFMEGSLLRPEEVDTGDILAASDFLAKLHNIPPTSSIPEERTSCFSIQDYFNLLKNRLTNLATYNDSFPLAEELKRFLEEKFTPLKDTLVQELNSLREPVLPLNKQVLTPGDFGFHNILVEKTKSKKIYSFLDFEYFGRDDPLKQILDFLHHDRHKAISTKLRNLFLQNYLDKTNKREEFSKRIHLIDPLIGLNWTLIYLTPFTKETLNQEELLRTRLNKAKTKIENIRYLKSGFF